MPLSLQPFGRMYRPPFGTVDQLPVTRDGVRHIGAPGLVPSSAPCYAGLRIWSTDGAEPVRGICGLLPATAFIDGRIRPHELTLNARLIRQRELITADAGGLGKPILLTAPNLDSMWAGTEGLLSSPENVSFATRKNRYELRELVAEGLPAPPPIPLLDGAPLVIADGHHRAATHAALAAAGNPHCTNVPVCLIDARDLNIGIFLRRLPEYHADTSTLLQLLDRHFIIQTIDQPTAPTEDGTWLMTYRNEHYWLQWKRDPCATTAADWMVNVVLRELFDIENASTDERLVNSPARVNVTGELRIKNPDELSFAGSPVSRQVFFDEVAAGRTLPPKSTRFTPRIPSGLVVWKGFLHC